MAKQSGKAQEAPPKEGIELQIEGMMFNVLMAMERKMLECIAKFEPPTPVTPPTATVPAKQVKTDEERRIEAINRERLAEFAKQKEAERAGANAEDFEDFKKFQAMKRKADN